MELIIRDKYIFLQGEKQFGSDMCMVSQLNQKRAHLDLQKNLRATTGWNSSCFRALQNGDTNVQKFEMAIKLL